MYAKCIKRILDLVISFFAIIVVSPLTILLFFIGIFEMKGNPFFTQERPGRHEKIFKLIKFRTMTNEKDEKGNLLPDDVRLTSYGKFLRSTSLDELPELFNIFMGQMAIVGPRPLLVRYLPYYTEKERHRHDVRPGLTGLSQIHGRNYTPWEERFRYDLEYVKKITFLGDVKIIMESIKVVFAHDGVADRSQIHTDENGDLFIVVDGVRHKYPKPLDMERKEKR